MQANHKLKSRNTLIAYSFLLPNFLGFLIFTLVPVAFAFFLSFCEWNSADAIRFVGLNNFKRFASDSTFKISLFNTFYYAVATVPLTVCASLGLAMLLNRKLRGINLFRAIFFFPYVASLVAIAVVWNLIFMPDYGPVNQILYMLGIQNPPRWTASTTWAMPTVIFVSMWRFMGYYMVIYLAALQGIPAEQYEAADIDGASAVQKFFKITQPALTPTTFFVTMMLTIQCFKVFDLIYVMTGGGPGRSTTVLVSHIYDMAFVEFRFGYSSAIAMVLFAIVLIVTIVQFRVEKKWVSYL